MNSQTIRVGLFYNLRKEYPISEELAADLYLEWDTEETINELKRGFNDINVEILDLKDPLFLLDSQVRESIDIVFSICEMTGTRFRESLVSSFCELVKKPYSFSSPDCLMICLDKNICNLLIQQQGILIPKSFIVANIESINELPFSQYPYFLKPCCEGSGIGINTLSLAHTSDEITSRSLTLLERYKQPVLIQQYLAGDDITIAVLQTGENIEAMTPLIGKLGKGMEPMLTDSMLKDQIIDVSEKIFKYLNCRDLARIDYKLSKDGQLHFLEINPLPLLSKSKGYFYESANYSYYSYESVLNIIIENTKKRFKIG